MSPTWKPINASRKIQDQVRMWKPASVAKVVEYDRYNEEMFGGKPFSLFNT